MSWLQPAAPAKPRLLAGGRVNSISHLPKRPEAVHDQEISLPDSPGQTQGLRRVGLNHVGEVREQPKIAHRLDADLLEIVEYGN